MEIISRREWGARPPRRRSTIPIPSRELWLHHTAGNHRGVRGMRQIQNFHMDVRGWSDIAYSFVIDQDTLQVFEGRGAGVLGGHTFGRNSISHAICIMGNFNVDKPSEALLDKIADLVRHGHERGWWPLALTGGHRDVRATSCPGDNLYRKIPVINAKAKKTDQGEDMPEELVRRLEAVGQRLGYTVNPDGKLEEREVAVVENMEQGIRKLIEAREELEAQMAEMAADALLGREVRKLVEEDS